MPRNNRRASKRTRSIASETDVTENTSMAVMTTVELDASEDSALTVDSSDSKKKSETVIRRSRRLQGKDPEFNFEETYSTNALKGAKTATCNESCVPPLEKQPYELEASYRIRRNATDRMSIGTATNSSNNSGGKGTGLRRSRRKQGLDPSASSSRGAKDERSDDNDVCSDCQRHEMAHKKSAKELSEMKKKWKSSKSQLSRERSSHSRSRSLLTGARDSLRREREAASEKHSQLANITECRMCTDLMAAPVSLSCGHSFCFTCITEWAQTQVCPTHGHHARCPHCRAEMMPTLDLRKADDIKVNTMLAEVCDTVAKTMTFEERADYDSRKMEHTDWLTAWRLTQQLQAEARAIDAAEGGGEDGDGHGHGAAHIGQVHDLGSAVDQLLVDSFHHDAHGHVHGHGHGHGHGDAMAAAFSMSPPVYGRAIDSDSDSEDESDDDDY